MIRVFIDDQDFIKRYVQKMSLKKKESVNQIPNTTLNTKKDPDSKKDGQKQTLFGNLLQEEIKKIK